MFKLALLFIFILFTNTSIAAQPHIHGEGQLSIAQDKQQWLFEFDLPAADMLGFEHHPETAEQIQKVAALARKIENVEHIIKLPAYCNLNVTEHSLNSVDTPSDSSKHSHSHKDESTHDTVYKHADITVTYMFDCAENPTSVEVSLFNWASSLSKLNAQWITDNQQGAMSLKPSTNVVRFIE